MADEGADVSHRDIPLESAATDDTKEEAVEEGNGGAATDTVNEAAGIAEDAEEESMEVEQINKRAREIGDDDADADGSLKKQRVEADGADETGEGKSVEEARLEEMGIENPLQDEEDDASPEAEGAEGDEGDDDGEGKVKEEKTKKPTGPVKLGPKVFDSSMAMFDYFFKFLHTWPININVNKYEHMVLWDLLTKGHHEPDKKVGPGVEAFQIRVHPMWHSRCYCLIRKDDTVDDFSYRKCIDSLIPLPANMKVSGNLKDKKGFKQLKEEQQSAEGGRGFGGNRRGGGRGRGRGRRGRGRGRFRG